MCDWEAKNATLTSSFLTVGGNCAYDFTCLGFILFISDAQYITCKMQNCSEASQNKPFPGYIDHNSLIVQDDYVFVQVQSNLLFILSFYILLCSVTSLCIHMHMY